MGSDMLKLSLGASISSCLFVLLPTSLAAQNRLQVDMLARTNGCYECHGTSRNMIGPSFESIAKHYVADTQGRAKLFSVIKNGGKGNWTEVTKGVPMPPHSGSLSDEEIRRLVDWVLSHQQ
jgi:cytochrome c551/c552